MKRRGHGEGSYKQRANGRWQARICLDGQRLCCTTRTKEEALKWLRERKADAEKGLLVVDDKIKVAEFLANWLKATEPTIEPKTFYGYGQTVRLYLNPSLGALKLSKLRADHVQRLYADKLGEGLSKRTVQGIHAVLHHALNDALKWHLVARNVCDAVKVPRSKRAETKVWTPEEAKTFLEGLAGERLEALYHLALVSAVRPGELLALRWEDVDLKARRIQIRRKIGRIVRKGLIVGNPKTDHSRRQIALPNSVIGLLRRWKAWQLQEKLLAGEKWRDSGYLFTTGVGTPIEERNLARSFQKKRQELGLPYIRLYDLRHTAATMLLLKGVHPKKVQELLGHSSIALTMDTYSHVLPTMHDEIADVMDQLFS